MLQFSKRMLSVCNQVFKIKTAAWLPPNRKKRFNQLEYLTHKFRRRTVRFRPLLSARGIPVGPSCTRVPALRKEMFLRKSLNLRRILKWKIRVGRCFNSAKKVKCMQSSLQNKNCPLVTTLPEETKNLVFDLTNLSTYLPLPHCEAPPAS